jgi:hypothetical protein
MLINGAKAGQGGVSTYREWLRHCEPRLFWPEDEIPDRISRLTYRPLISVILPTYNTHPNFLKRCIESVLEQKYPHWQLCVADDCSSNPAVVEYLRKIAAQDPRVEVTVRSSRGGISAASNTALELVKGEWTSFLDHDDELHPCALLEVVRWLNACDGADLLYSDEDKLDVHGNRCQPAFKPDFDMDMFLSFNYLCHLAVLRSSVVSQIGGFRSNCDGAQDWDLLIRAVESIGASAVQHIPKPLYHWRMHEQSTAMTLDAKPYVRNAWVKVLSDHIERTGQRATAEPGLFYGSMRIRRQRPEGIRIAVVVRAQDGSFQAAAVGANADDQYTTFYQLIGSSMRRIGGAIVNSLADTTEEVFVFINRPLETVNHLFLNELSAQAMRPDCGLVTGISVDSQGIVVHSGLIQDSAEKLMDPFAGSSFSQSRHLEQLNVIRAVEAVSDEFFAVRREHLAAIGGVAAVSAAKMPKLARQLAKNAHDKGFRVLTTPYAVATLDDATQSASVDPLHPDEARAGIRINVNWAAFDKLAMLNGDL